MPLIGPDPTYGQLAMSPEDANSAALAATAATAGAVMWAEERLLNVLRLMCVGQALRADAAAETAAETAAVGATTMAAAATEAAVTDAGAAVALPPSGDEVAMAAMGVHGFSVGGGGQRGTTGRPDAFSHGEYGHVMDAADTYVPALSAMQAVLEWGNSMAGVGRTMGRRIEDLGAVMNDLAAVIDWRDEAVAVVEHDLREMLCLLLDVDRNFDLTSPSYPAVLGGAVSVLLRELVLHLSEEQLCTQIVPLVQRLAVSQSVSSRVTCCGIVPLVYGGLPLLQQLQLRGVLSR
ncbi:unnamed protein product [Phaeothamnion confervicola]